MNIASAPEAPGKLDFSREAHISRIEIVEWLGPKDRKTGQRLYEHLETLQVAGRVPIAPAGPLEIKIRTANSKAEFLAILAQIAQETSVRSLPILHLETHGAADGLSDGEGEVVFWHEISDVLRAINVRARNNLVLVAGACYGIAAVNVAADKDPLSPSAFFLAIGPLEAVGARSLESCFCTFYEEFFTTRDFTKACNEGAKKLGSEIRGMTAERLFYSGVARYIEDCLTETAIHERLERLAHRGVNRARRRALKAILLKQRRPTSWAQEYGIFMHHQEPENRNRFRFDRQRLEAQVEMEKRRQGREAGLPFA